MMLRRKKNNSEEYFLSISYGTLDGLKEHLRHTGNANLAGAGGRSLLHKAVEEGNIEKVSLLISYNCNVSISDNEGNTPLHDAIHLGNHAITTFLVKHDGTNVNIVNVCGITPLMQAVIKEDVPICKLLLAHGASVTCLYRKATEIARVLCSNNELLSIFLPLKSFNHHFHLQEACRNRNYSQAEIILPFYENPLQGLELITQQEHIDISTWERCAKAVVNQYKFATDCSGNNKLLSMLLNFCGSNYNHAQREYLSHRATLLVRRLFMYGLKIHPQTSFVSCKHDCECRLSIKNALDGTGYVPQLQGLCCSVIRQNMSSTVNFELSAVAGLPITKKCKDLVTMGNW